MKTKIEINTNNSDETVMASSSYENNVTNHGETFTQNEDIVDSIKKDVIKKWKENEEKKRITFKERYEQMVEEAVIVIKDAWETSSSIAARNEPCDIITVEVVNAFVVSKDLSVYCTKQFIPNNPATKKSCFFDHFQLPNQYVLDRYVNEVLSRLPKGTVMNVSSIQDMILGKCTLYGFSLMIDMTT